jgi:MFS family permease
MTPVLSERPTHARHKVIVFAITLAILSYVSRVCISQAAPSMMRDLHLTQEQMGHILGAFGLSYALFEIPTGWLGDWIGPRRVLLRIVLWWSAFTALTGWMFNFWALWITRFLFGAGEAGGFPNLTKAFTVWLPLRERLRAQSIMWTAARWGGAFTPKFVVLVLLFMSWRWSFVFFGALGLFWAVPFYLWFRDDPRRHHGVNAAEAALIGDTGRNAAGHANVPWLRMLRSRSVWLLWFQYFCLTFSWCFYITWMPDYLMKYWRLTPSQGGTFAIMPLFLGGLGCLVCGGISRRIATSAGGPRNSRRILGVAGFLGAGVLLFVSSRLHSPLFAMIAMGLSSFFNDLTIPPSWAACMDIGGRFAGTLSGSMNMMGNLASYAGPVVGAYLVGGNAARYPIFLAVMAGTYFIGALCWPFIDPVTPLDPDAPAH